MSQLNLVHRYLVVISVQTDANCACFSLKVDSTPSLRGGGVKERIQFRSCRLRPILWDCSLLYKAARCRLDTVPHPADLAGFGSCGERRAWGPPWGSAAPPDPYQTPRSGESLCWWCGRGILRYRESDRFLCPSTPSETRRSGSAGTAEGEPQSPAFWDVRERSGAEAWEEKRCWDQAAGGPQTLHLNF